MAAVFDTLSRIGIVPVIKINDAADAVSLCAALKRGGLPAAEITFRTDAAEESIRLIHENMPEILLGAGTVLTTEQVDRAVNAGASFIVSPGLNPKVVSYCVERAIPVLPGCANPSDIELAMELGLQTVKFFPAEALGGIKLIKAIAAPYGSMTFVPTGGINEKNVNEYLSFPKITCVGGSWMVPGDAVAQKDWDRIEQLTKSAVDAMLGFEIAHLGINYTDRDAMTHCADSFTKMLSWKQEAKGSAIFCGEKGLELMTEPSNGAVGHIAIATNNLRRAMWHMENRGFTIDTNSITDKIFYIKEEFNGFAVHFRQK